jgi:hypothetical protein
MCSIRGHAASVWLRQTQIDKNPTPIATKRSVTEKPQPTSIPNLPRVATEWPPITAALNAHEVQMKSMTMTAALTGILAVATVTSASAWERNGIISGPRGTNTFNAQGSCSRGSCSRSATATGAYGRTATRSGSGSCSGGNCSGSRTTTGPAGRSVTRSFSVTR